jgi:hypothetical protein
VVNANGNYVHLTGAETIDGTKTFLVSPVVPVKTSDIDNLSQAIATEAQVWKVKQDVDLRLPVSGGIISGNLKVNGNVTLGDTINQLVDIRGKLYNDVQLLNPKIMDASGSGYYY